MQSWSFNSLLQYDSCQEERIDGWVDWKPGGRKEGWMNEWNGWLLPRVHWKSRRRWKMILSTEVADPIKKSRAMIGHKKTKTKKKQKKNQNRLEPSPASRDSNARMLAIYDALTNVICETFPEQTKKQKNFKTELANVGLISIYPIFRMPCSWGMWRYFLIALPFI